MAYVDIRVGDVVTIAGIDWIVLEKREYAAFCLTKNLVYERMMFDRNTNNYANSSIRDELNNHFLTRIIDAVGSDALLNVEIDLTSDDGLDDYGVIFEKVGLLTDNMYRRYNRTIERYPVGRWWWLATPYSTTHRGYSCAVRCVDGGGALVNICCGGNGGVRPFCVFKSSIFES